MAELVALLYGLRIALHSTAGSTVRIVYDNRYAANITLQLWRPRTNTPLVRALCAVAAATSVHHRFLWQWVCGHSGHLGNEQADLLGWLAMKVTPCVGPLPSARGPLPREVFLVRHCPTMSCTASHRA
ncbi:MAG: ribonuclease HI, partial [Candidatus Fonsibacter sp.]